MRSGSAPDDTIESVERELFDASLISPAEWPALIAILAQGSKTDREQADRLRAMRTGDRRRNASPRCSRSSAPPTAPPRRASSPSAFATGTPTSAAALSSEQKRICALLDRRRAVITRTRTGALLTLASAVIARYRAEKEARGLLDYDDLIAKTRDLLTRVSAAWVHYKLDLGIDHLLIDEAQDTSPEQWDIIEQLVAEFAAGAGARGDAARARSSRSATTSSRSSRSRAPTRASSHEKQVVSNAPSRPPRSNGATCASTYSFRSNDSVLTAVAARVPSAGRSSAA